MGKHQKHAKLKLRDNDNFAPNEISIVGTNCSEISRLVSKVSKQLMDYKLAYFDASHSKDIESLELESFTFHHKGTVAVSMNSEVNKFNQRVQFSQYDFVLSMEIIIREPNKFWCWIMKRKLQF